METATLFNIKAKTHKTNNSLIGKASAMDLFAAKKTDNFKSAYKIQLDKHSEEKSRLGKGKDKSLPQSGNDLPNKKPGRDKQENHVQEKVDHAQKNDAKKDDSYEQASEKLQNDSQKQQSDYEKENDRIANKNKDSAIISEASAYDAENAEIQLNESSQNLTDQQQNELNSNESFNEQDDLLTMFNTQADPETSNSGTQTSDIMASDAMVTETTVPELMTPEHISDDKKVHSEAISGQKNIFQPLSSAQINSDLDSRTGTDKKNDSPIGKSIADFQYFIEMSKKHSSASEAIASVKGFEENLKTEQLNAQLIKNEIKLPVGQHMAPTQLAMQIVSSERVSSTNNFTSTALLQNLPSLEVKTAVGKSGWNHGFANQIFLMASNGIQQAKIKLNPMHLGPVEAMVKLKGETAVVNLTSLHLTTREAMDNATPRLKEMLNENGFSQVDVNVSHQDKKEQHEANLSSNKERSNSEHGNSTMPGEEQLSEVNHDSESDVQATDSPDQGLNIVDYYA